MFVCLYVYAFCLFLSRYMYMGVCMSIFFKVYILYVHIYVCMSNFMYVRLYVCVCMYMFMSGCLCIFMRLCY